MDFIKEDILEIFGLSEPITQDKINSLINDFDNNSTNDNEKEYNEFLKEALVNLQKYHDSNKIIGSANDLDNYTDYTNPIMTTNPILIPEKKQFGINTNELGYTSSNLNQIKRDIITRMINIDSIFRKDPTSDSNDFIFEFKEDFKNVISYKLSSLELPNIWYTFSDYLRNNTFTVKVNNFSTGARDGSSNNIIYDSGVYEILIPEGNYNPSEITDILNNIFINTGDGMKFLLFEISQYTGKCIFRVKTKSDQEYQNDPMPFVGDETTNDFYSPDISFEINFDLEEYRITRLLQRQIIEQYSGNICDLSCSLLNIYNTQLRPIEYNCGHILGFSKDIYIFDSSNQFLNITKDTVPILYKCYLESEGYYGNTINKYIFLKVDDYNNSKYNNFINDNKYNSNNDNILAKIPVNYGSFSMIYNNNSDFIKKERTFFGPVNIKKIRLSLVDRFDRLVDIGKSIYSITLEITQLYS